MDLKLDYATGDLLFQNGPLTKEYTTQPFTQTVAQRLFIMLGTFEGEWFLNTLHGVPYFQKILGRKTSKSAVDLIIQQKVLAERGVKEITHFKSSLVNRKYYLDLKVKVSTGEETELITISPTI